MALIEKGVRVLGEVCWTNNADGGRGNVEGCFFGVDER